MTDAFVRFMVSPAGRATRVAAGLGLVAWDLSRRESPSGQTAAALGPLLGAPLSGARARAAVR